ncbi:MAG: hypothetical protein E6Q98_09040 [Rhodospirillaceae bacterium]|nr:MAG: hypothetical protein E6Q98_09040 [Rhodospirillaceae bacterium]
MSADEKNVAFERIVTANLTRAVDILRFAETKNAALLTFCSAWIIASVNMLKGGSTMSREYGLALTIALMLFAIAAMLSVWSIAPRLMHRAKGKAPERPRNCCSSAISRHWRSPSARCASSTGRRGSLS